MSDRIKVLDKGSRNEFVSENDELYGLINRFGHAFQKAQSIETIEWECVGCNKTITESLMGRHDRCGKVPERFWYSCLSCVRKGIISKGIGESKEWECIVCKKVIKESLRNEFKRHSRLPVKYWYLCPDCRFVAVRLGL